MRLSEKVVSRKTLAARPTTFGAYDRSLKGPKVDERDWDFRIIPGTAKRLKEKYGIRIERGD